MCAFVRSPSRVQQEFCTRLHQDNAANLVGKVFQTHLIPFQLQRESETAVVFYLFF